MWPSRLTLSLLLPVFTSPPLAASRDELRRTALVHTEMFPPPANADLKVKAKLVSDGYSIVISVDKREL